MVLLLSINEGRDDNMKLLFKVRLKHEHTHAPYTARLKVTVDQHVARGEELTEGSIDPKELIKSTKMLHCSRVLVT